MPYTRRLLSLSGPPLCFYPFRVLPHGHQFEARVQASVELDVGVEAIHTLIRVPTSLPPVEVQTNFSTMASTKRSVKKKLSGVEPG